MRLRTLGKDLITFAVLAAIGYLLYIYSYRDDSSNEGGARYQENLQNDTFNQVERVERNDDDCYRFANPVQIEACAEARN